MICGCVGELGIILTFCWQWVKLSKFERDMKKEERVCWLKKHSLRWLFIIEMLIRQNEDIYNFQLLTSNHFSFFLAQSKCIPMPFLCMLWVLSSQPFARRDEFLAIHFLHVSPFHHQEQEICCRHTHTHTPLATFCESQKKAENE